MVFKPSVLERQLVTKDSILLNRCQKSEVKWSYHFSSVGESSPHSLNAFLCHVIAVEGLTGLEPKPWPNSEGVRNPHFSARDEKLEAFNPQRTKSLRQKK